jgi:hypothetical protein
MTREEVIKLAKQSGLFVELVLERDLDWLERFATLVASAECERVNAYIKELERDAARYREVREWNFCGYDHGLISPESVDRAVDDARGDNK